MAAQTEMEGEVPCLLLTGASYPQGQDIQSSSQSPTPSRPKKFERHILPFHGFQVQEPSDWVQGLDGASTASRVQMQVQVRLTCCEARPRENAASTGEWIATLVVRASPWQPPTFYRSSGVRLIDFQIMLARLETHHC